MFRSSFNSCRTRNLSDVIEKAVHIPQTHNFHMIHHHHSSSPSSSSSSTSPPKARPFPSICKPKHLPETTTNSIFPRQKLSSRYPPFISANRNGHSCPPASPAIFPLDPYYKELGGFKDKKKSSGSSSSRSGKKKKKKKEDKKSKKNINSTTSSFRRDMSLFSSTSHDTAYFEGSCYWFSSEDEEDEREEDESEALFSSRSLSSDSSGSLRRHHHHRRCRRKKAGSSTTGSSLSRRRRAAANNNNTKSSGSGSSQVGVLLGGKLVKDSFAVVKSSSDPYNDFRTSMVEMIIEKQIFAAKDLEQLLQCFLSLNSDRHHKIIVEVFTEIWETLFSNWY
ncbi:hypothetical protein Tsubulata_034350 [Turnera subulata]|uniref:Transcription repressor n=1 Tax=Turnera subulata TaxID=218843 RepID=A0A9Q0FL72_9ROSI|nr:hypothetical protein Tsubulata_034350 [Turnera subulata]